MMKLYPFQQEMVDKFEITPSVLCADDMGLGKTVEALALDLRRRTTQLNGYKQTSCKTLIIAPLSVLPSWDKHIKMIWPAARTIMINPKNRDELIAALNKPYHYYIVHWEALRLVSELKETHWWHIIADEVHRAKNRKAQQTIALKKLRTSYKTACSGTPADNNPEDLWSILNWLYPKTWTSHWGFVRHYVKIQAHNQGFCLAFNPETGEQCSQNHKRAYRKVVGVANVEQLHEAVESYFIRRTKDEVIKDLPDKYYTTIEVDLLPKQRRIYEQMRKDMLAWVGKHEHEPVAAPMVIAQLTRLKQFALGYAELETVRRGRKDCGECKHLGMDKCVGHDMERVKLSEPSAKLDALMEKIEDNPDEPFVVFSESKQIIKLLAGRLNRAGVSHVLLTGDTPQVDRARVVDAFQSGEVRVFAGTIAAGGEGITLTASRTVVFLDRTWNPSRNKQAEDRLHRIGQKNAVQVIDIVARDTVDGGRLQMLSLKWSWLKRLLGDKEEVQVEIAGVSA
jgi:SNF2 family DNA or RNA helicase